jgi:SAM-dependent methyltransferase
MTNNFNNYSRYYDLLYKDKDYKEEVEYLMNLIENVNPNSKYLIELGSGTGNHAFELCKKGFIITGLERSTAMVNLARAKFIDGFSTLVADIENYELHQTFDAAISLFHVICYLNSNDSLIACFNSTNKHLKPGGIFIFDVWYSPAVYNLKPTRRTKKMEDDCIDVTRHSVPVIHYNTNVVDVNYEIIIKDKMTDTRNLFKEKHPMRHFSFPEIELLADLTGFKLIKAEEYLTGKVPGNDTWSVCFILKKK